MPIAAVAWFYNAGQSLANIGITTSGFVAGDLCVAISMATGASFDPAMQLPTDDQSNAWTLRSKSVWASGIDEGVIGIYDCKIAGTGPTSVTINTLLGENVAGVVLRVTGHDPTNYFDQAASGGATATTSCPSPSLATVGPRNRLVVQGIIADVTRTVSVLSNGYAIQQQSAFAIPTKAWGVKVTAPGTENPLPRWTVAGGTADYEAAAAAYREGAQPFDFADPRIGWVGA